jgi:hypothetical protein
MGERQEVETLINEEALLFAMLNTHSAEHTAWAIVILIFSIVSFLDMGGFIIGALMGVAGGALALAYRPASKQ